MALPRLFKHSVEDFLSNCPNNGNIFQILISSRTDPGHPVLIKYLRRYLPLKISKKRILEYVPPGTVGDSQTYRKEKIPTISNTKGTCLIIDDCVEDGNTFDSAVQALKKQGISEKNIWFFVGRIIEKRYDGQACFLDKANVFLEYKSKREIK